MHMTCICFFFSFSKAVLHNILKLLSLGQLLQQFTLNTAAIRSGTPRRSEQSALQRRPLNLGERLNRSPFLVGKSWGRTGVSFKKRINKKRKNKQTKKRNKTGQTTRRKKFKMWQQEQQKGQAKTWRPPTLPPPYPIKPYDLKLSISSIRPRTGKTRQGRSISRNVSLFSKPSDTMHWRLFTTEMAVLCCFLF